jgi:hypothetical protein
LEYQESAPLPLLPLSVFLLESALNMAGFLRGKQSGIQSDLSASILPGLFAPDDQARYGINSQIGYVARNPRDSLLTLFILLDR